MRFILLTCAFVLYIGCTDPSVQPPIAVLSDTALTSSEPVKAFQGKGFKAVIANVKPVAERFCQQRTQGVDCNFLIRVDPDKTLPANAYQSRNQRGRPVLTFTQALLKDAHNDDEIAFILGHEAAHHIGAHIDKTQSSAIAGAVVGSAVAAIFGVEKAAKDLGRIGANVGSRVYSKQYEFEADSLGALIAYEAGYNPEKGSLYFSRIADPGNVFLGTHPPNPKRVAFVEKTMQLVRQQRQNKQ